MAIVQAKLWYHPQWFAKYVPDPDIEGERLEHRLAEAEAAREPAPLAEQD
jgi:RND superfamily putative drug exporter